MCLCMLMHATMNHEGHQGESAPTPNEGSVSEMSAGLGDSARELLDKRYARGEIKRDEYLTMRADMVG